MFTAKIFLPKQHLRLFCSLFLIFEFFFLFSCPDLLFPTLSFFLIVYRSLSSLFTFNVMHSLLFIVIFALYVSFVAIFNQMKIFCVGDICETRLHSFIICLPARLYAMFLVPLNSHSSHLLRLPLCQAPFSTCRLIFSLFLLTPPHFVTTLYPSSSISLS